MIWFDVTATHGGRCKLVNTIYSGCPAIEDDPLTELALGLRWTWNQSTDELWRELDPAVDVGSAFSGAGE